MRRHGVIAGLVVAAVITTTVVLWLTSRRSDPTDRYRPRPAGTLTFNKDIAPVIHRECLICHRPGESAPFTLLSYSDVKRHATQIVDVTMSGFMPPWLPEPDLVPFMGERRLSVDLEPWKQPILVFRCVRRALLAMLGIGFMQRLEALVQVRGLARTWR